MNGKHVCLFISSQSVYRSVLEETRILYISFGSSYPSCLGTGLVKDAERTNSGDRRSAR